MMRCQKQEFEKKSRCLGKNSIMSISSSSSIANVISLIVIICSCFLIQTTLTMPTAEFEAHHLDNDEPKFLVIKEDVIPDVENTTQKVIRVNPLDLPPIRDDPTGSSDSDLYKIKALLPANRNYVNTKRMRRPRPIKPQTQMSMPTNGIDGVDDGRSDGHHIVVAAASGDSPIIRHKPNVGIDGKLQKPKHQQAHKKKQLHFLYNQEAQDGRLVGKSMQVHIAPGAYPVYYAVSKTNGRFGKYPIKGFRNEREFQKYLVKSKLEPIALKDDHYES